MLLLLVSPALLVAAVVASWFGYSASVAGEERSFEAIREGEARQSVVSALGRPSQVRACGENLWWGNDANYRGKNDGRCVTEERYERFLVAFGVGYSADGKVVSKYQYVSE